MPWNLWHVHLACLLSAYDKENKNKSLLTFWVINLVITCLDNKVQKFPDTKIYALSAYNSTKSKYRMEEVANHLVHILSRTSSSARMFFWNYGVPLTFSRSPFFELARSSRALFSRVLSNSHHRHRHHHRHAVQRNTERKKEAAGWLKRHFNVVAPP